ncbi:MAG: RDD family protein [Deltaproteobacteria bacterium]|nr:MAG: RDD family protein [Deltaproteobacteria bacterium]
MKCNSCGFNTFDYLDKCNKCGGIFASNSKFKHLYSNPVNNRSKRRSLKIEGLDNTLIIKPNGNLSQQIKSNNLNSNQKAVQNSEQVSSSIKESLNGKNHTQLPEPKLNIPTKSDIFEPDFKYNENKIYVQASAESRIAAFFIDFGILNILSLACLCCALLISGYKIDRSLLELKEVIIPVYFILLFLSTSYFVVMQGFGGSTIGKLILRLKVVKKDGLDIGYLDSFIRFVGYFISSIPVFLGFLWSCIDSNSQAWHDKIAGTVVIEK